MDKKDEESPAFQQCLQLISSRSLPSIIACKRRCSEQDVHRAISDYLRSVYVKRTDSERIGEAARWLENLRRGQKCDNYLMQSGTADLSFSSSTFVFPVSFAQLVVQCASFFPDESVLRANSDVERDALVDKAVMVLRGRVGKKPANVTVIYIPIHKMQHWGLVAVKFDTSPTRVRIQWGDSLRRKCPPAVFSAVRYIIERAFDGVKCTIDDHTNYMIDTHHFARQEDTFSSGFFVLSLLSTCAHTARYLPISPLRKYDSAHIEDIRDACIASYFHHMLDLHRDNSHSPLFKDEEIFNYLMSRAKVNCAIEGDTDDARHKSSSLKPSTTQTQVESTTTTKQEGQVEQNNQTPASSCAVPEVEDQSTGEVGTEAADETADDENDESQADNVEDQAQSIIDESPKTTVFVPDIVKYFKQLASQGYFFGNTSHQGLKGRSVRGQLYRAYIQLRCIKYPGDRKRKIPRCPAKLRFDKLRDQEGWHASLFCEHSHPPLPEELRSRREGQVVRTLKDVQMWYLPKNQKSQQSNTHAVTPDSDRFPTDDKSSKSDQRSVAGKILPRPPHLRPDGQPLQPVLVPRISRPKGPQPGQPSQAHLTVQQVRSQIFPQHVQTPVTVHPTQTHVSLQTTQPPSSSVSIHPAQTHVAVHPGQSQIAMHPSQQNAHPQQPQQSSQPGQRTAVPIAPRQIITGAVVTTLEDRSISINPAVNMIHAPVPTTVQNNPSVSPSSVPTLSTTNKPGGSAKGNNVGIEHPQSNQNHIPQDELRTLNGQAAINEEPTDGVTQTPMDVITSDGILEAPSVETVHNGPSEAALAPEPMEDAFKSSGEDLVGVKNGGATLALVEAIRAYVNTSHLKLVENEMAHHIKKIAEQCGYKLRIRRSMYHAGEENVFIKSATFECAQKVRNSCPFAFRLRGHLKRKRSGESSGEGSQSDGETNPNVRNSRTVYTTTVQFIDMEHNHEHDPSLLQKHIAHPPPNPIKQAVSLAREGSITVGNVIRHVEKKHSFMVPRGSLRKRIVEERETKDPLARQCNALVARLMHLKNEEKSMYVHFSTEGPRNTLSRICWSFPEWQNDYMNYGRVPGIYTDSKNISEIFKLPLVSINGRTNAGDTLVFFMAFIAEKKEDSMKWLFEQFKSCMSWGEVYSPKIIAVEQCTATVTAVRDVFPSSWLIFDEKTLSDHESESVQKFLQEMDMSHMREEMIARLRVLRNARNPEELDMLRKGVEGTFFSGNNGELPSWYKYLYYTEKELVVQCFNRSLCGLRFAFDGVGYAHSYSSIHKLMIEDASIESHKVPEVVRQAATIRRSLQEQKRKTVDESLVDLLVSANLYDQKYRTDLALLVVRTFTDFCLQYLVKEVAEKAYGWRIRLFNISPDRIEEDVTVKTVTFQVVNQSSGEEGDGESNSTVEFDVSVLRRCSSTAVDTLESMCTCKLSKICGMPCAHQIAVIRSYNGRGVDMNVSRAHLNTAVLPLSHFIHNYWKRDVGAWRHIIPKLRYEVSLDGQDNMNEDANHIGGTNRTREVFEASQSEWQGHLTYSLNKELFDQAWSAVDTMTNEQKAAFHKMMQEIVACCRQKQVPTLSLFNGTMASAGTDEHEGQLVSINVGSEEGGGVDRVRQIKRTSGPESPPSQRRRTDGDSNVGDFEDGYVRSEVFSNDLSHMQHLENVPLLHRTLR